MAYEQHYFQDGNTLTASQLNDMDGQIASNESAITGLNQSKIDKAQQSADPYSVAQVRGGTITFRSLNQLTSQPLEGDVPDAKSVYDKLGLKADKAQLTNGLAAKADQTALTNGLATKADQTALTNGLATKVSLQFGTDQQSGKILSLDDNGKIAASTKETLGLLSSDSSVDIAQIQAGSGNKGKIAVVGDNGYLAAMAKPAFGSFSSKNAQVLTSAPDSSIKTSYVTYTKPTSSGGTTYSSSGVDTSITGTFCTAAIDKVNGSTTYTNIAVTSCMLVGKNTRYVHFLSNPVVTTDTSSWKIMVQLNGINSTTFPLTIDDLYIVVYYVLY